MFSRPITNNSKRLISNISVLVILFCAIFSYQLATIKQVDSWFAAESLGWLVVLQFGLMTLAMLIAWLVSPRSNQLIDYRWLIIGAVLARLVLFWVEPYTSNDVDRYLFDGKIALSGFDPYQISHDAPQLANLRASWAPPDEHAKYATLYPPLALALFSFAALADVEHAFLIWKLLVTSAGFLTLILTIKILQKLDRLHHLPLVALSPLLILETSVGLHLDSFSALFVCATIYYFQLKKLKLAGVFIGLGALVKLLPIVLLAPLFFGLKNFKSKFSICLAAISTITIGYLVVFSIGFIPVGSIGVFFEKWRFGSPIFSSLELVFTDYSLLVIIMILAIIGFLTLIYRAHVRTHSIKADSLLFHWALAIPLLLSPVIFPWYLMALVPLLAIRPSFFLLFWTSLIPLTYEVLGQFACCQSWEPSDWPLLIIGLSLLFGVYLDWKNLNDRNNKFISHVEDSPANYKLVKS